MINKNIKIENYSYNAWLNKHYEMKIENKKHSFCAGLADLLENTSMHGYSRIVEPKRMIIEKLIWLAFHISACAALFFVLSHAWTEFTTRSISTVLQNPLYPIEEIPFPAVSVCSNNRLSKDAAAQYAKKLVQLDPDKRNLSYFMENIKLLSSMYNFEVGENDRAIYFQRFLDTYDLNDTEIFFNIKQRMFELTPKCSNLLLKCLLMGETVECISKNAFSMQITQLGYCCVFNVNHGDSLQTKTKDKSFKNAFIGSELGLTVVLNTSNSDDYYTLFDLNGFLVHIYDSNLFDDISSGSIRERFVFKGRESLIAVTPKVVGSDDAIRKFHPKTRDCLFKDELMEKYGGKYSLTNCITQCRIRSIRVLCRCVPFFMPNTKDDREDNVIHCTLQHIDCLDRYRFKWSNVVTMRKNVEGLEREMEDALYCPECLPGCTETHYSVTLMTMPLDRYQINITSIVSEFQNLSEISILRVYFGDSTAKYYNQVIKSPWFEVFSAIGGICGIVTGFSLGAISEIIYFVLIEISSTIKAAMTADKNKTRKRKLLIYP